MIASSPIIDDAGDGDAGDQELDERHVSILPRRDCETASYPTSVLP